MPKLHNVQLLRAAAALMVVCVHLTPLLDRIGIPAPSGGVDLFFVISGFIMVTVAGDMEPGKFLARRCARIVPLYWAMTLFTAACVVLAPAQFQNTSADARSLILSLLFIPFAKVSGAMPQPILFVGWTLNYEMFFYLLFAAGLAMRRVAFVFGALLALTAAGVVLRPQGVAAAFYTSPLLLEFALGMTVALISRRWRAPWALALIALPLALYGDWLAPDLNRVVSLGLPAAALLLGAVALDKRGYCWPRLSPLGDASYAIYLIHPFITSAAVAAAARLPADPMVTIALILGAAAVTCAASRLIFVGLERPITNALNRGALNRGHLVGVNAIQEPASM